jgi:hypothetical protein
MGRDDEDRHLAPGDGLDASAKPKLEHQCSAFVGELAAQDSFPVGWLPSAAPVTSASSLVVFQTSAIERQFPFLFCPDLREREQL